MQPFSLSDVRVCATWGIDTNTILSVHRSLGEVSLRAIVLSLPHAAALWYSSLGSVTPHHKIIFVAAS